MIKTNDKVMKMIFKNSNLVKVLSIGLLIQNSNVNAFDLSDVTNAVDQVNSVAKQLNAPQPIPSIPTPQVAAITPTAITEIPKEFQGKWIDNLTNCVGNPADVIGFDVSKDDISYGTSWGGKIKTIKWITQGASIEVTSEDCEDGDCQTVTRNLSLSDSGSSLSVSNSLGGAEKYSRCGTASSGFTAIPPSVSDTTKEIIFSCKTKNGKMISLSQSGNIIEYSFGFSDKKPELLIDTPEENVSFEQNKSVTAASFEKGNYTYTVGRYIVNGVVIEDAKNPKKIIAKVECKQSTEDYKDYLDEYMVQHNKL